MHFRAFDKVGQGTRTDLHDNVREVKPKYGNSRVFALERLSRQRPDLFRRVEKGELSANAAAIEAGFRKKLSAQRWYGPQTHLVREPDQQAGQRGV
jgi:hypothetical protein